MTEVELLKAARAKVEQGWCQGSHAINNRGESVATISYDACAWCALGALISVHRTNAAFNLARRWVERRILPLTIPEYNDADGRTQEEVLALFDQAIKDAEGGVWIS